MDQQMLHHLSITPTLATPTNYRETSLDKIITVIFPQATMQTKNETLLGAITRQLLIKGEIV